MTHRIDRTMFPYPATLSWTEKVFRSWLETEDYRDLVRNNIRRGHPEDCTHVDGDVKCSRVYGHHGDHCFGPLTRAFMRQDYIGTWGGWLIDGAA